MYAGFSIAVLWGCRFLLITLQPHCDLSAVFSQREAIARANDKMDTAREVLWKYRGENGWHTGHSAEDTTRYAQPASEQNATPARN